VESRSRQTLRRLSAICHAAQPRLPSERIWQVAAEAGMLSYGMERSALVESTELY